MKLVDRKAEVFAKGAFAKKRGADIKHQGVQNIHWNTVFPLLSASDKCLCQFTAVKPTLCMVWVEVETQKKDSHKEGNIALRLFTNAYESCECIAMLKITCCWSIFWDKW